MNRSEFDGFLLYGAGVSAALLLFTLYRASQKKSTYYLAASWLFTGVLLLAIRSGSSEPVLYTLGFFVCAALVADFYFRGARGPG